MVSFPFLMLLFWTKLHHCNCVARGVDTSNPCPGVVGTVGHGYTSFIIPDVGACCYCNAGSYMKSICLKDQPPNSRVCTPCQFNSDKPDEQYFISVQPHNLTQCKLSIQTCPNGLTRINGNTTSDAQCVFMNSTTTTPLTTLPVISSPTDSNIPGWGIFLIVLVILIAIVVAYVCWRKKRSSSNQSQSTPKQGSDLLELRPFISGGESRGSSNEEASTERHSAEESRRSASISCPPSGDTPGGDVNNGIAVVDEETSRLSPGSIPGSDDFTYIDEENRDLLKDEDIRIPITVEEQKLGASPIREDEIAHDQCDDRTTNNGGNNPEELTRSTSPRDHSRPNSQASTLTGATSTSIPGPSNRVSIGDVDHSRVVIDEYDPPDIRKSRILEESTLASPIDDHENALSEHDSQDDGNVHDQPRNVNIHQPHDVNVYNESARDQCDNQTINDEPSRSSHPGDSSSYLNHTQQSTTSSRDNTDHNAGSNQPSTSNNGGSTQQDLPINSNQSIINPRPRLYMDPEDKPDDHKEIVSEMNVVGGPSDDANSDLKAIPDESNFVPSPDNPGTSQSPNQQQNGNSALNADDNRVETQSEPQNSITYINEGSRVINGGDDPLDIRKSKNLENLNFVSPRDDEDVNDDNIRDPPRDDNIRDPPRDDNVRDSPRDANVRDSPHDANVRDSPRGANVRDSPRDANVRDSPRDANVPDTEFVNDEPSRSSQPGDSSSNLNHTPQSTTSSRHNTDHNAGSNQPSTSNNSDPSSSTTPQNSSRMELMWGICDRLCESVDYFLPMSRVYFLLVWFGYRRLNENFETLQRTREQRIQELFRLLVKDHEDGKLDDFPQRFKDFLLEKDLNNIFEYEIEPLYSEYHIEVE